MLWKTEVRIRQGKVLLEQFVVLVVREDFSDEVSSEQRDEQEQKMHGFWEKIDREKSNYKTPKWAPASSILEAVRDRVRLKCLRSTETEVSSERPWLAKLCGDL